MPGSQIELNYRVSNTFGPDELIRVYQLTIENIGFDVDTQFDLVVHKTNDERQLLEVIPADISQYIYRDVWPVIHQVIFSNHWIKGMNVKIQLVRRPENSMLTVKCEVEDVERRTQFINKLEEFVAKGAKADANTCVSEQDRERLFGSMIMTEAVIQATRKQFLAGDFKQALSAAVNLLTTRLEHLLKTKLKNLETLLSVLTQKPARIIFPDSAGNQLHEELAGLGHLSVGILTLVKSQLVGKKNSPEDPVRVLKYLILISMLLERLENATLNVPKAAAQKTKATKPATKARGKKKSAKKTVAKKTKKTSPQQSGKAKSKVSAKKKTKKASVKKVKMKKR